MLRLFSAATKLIVPSVLIKPQLQAAPKLLSNQIIARNFSLLGQKPAISFVQQPLNLIQQRNVQKFSIRKGKRKSVSAVPQRFYRLHWGIWIRCMAGRKKKLWRKSPPRKRRLRQHVFCNATQSLMLDKMVGPYWRKRRYYVDDPYEPYHNREEFALSAKQPRPYIPREQT